jgi:hypothetical protein
LLSDTATWYLAPGTWHLEPGKDSCDFLPVGSNGGNLVDPHVPYPINSKVLEQQVPNLLKILLKLFL